MSRLRHHHHCTAVPTLGHPAHTMAALHPGWTPQTCRGHIYVHSPLMHAHTWLAAPLHTHTARTAGSPAAITFPSAALQLHAPAAPSQ